MPAATPYTAYASPLVLLRVENKAAPDLLFLMKDWRLEDHKTKADMAVWTFTDPSGALIDDSRFEPDTEWTFRFGYAGDISQTWKHKVKYYEPVYGEDGTIQISVTTMGKICETMKVKKPTNWGSIPSSDIAIAVAKRYGFKTKVEASKDAIPGSAQIQPQDMSDYEYLHALASTIDYEFFVEGDTLYYRSREGAFSEPPRHTFYWWGDNTPTLLKSFKPAIKSTKPGKVKVSHTDAGKGKKGAHFHSVVTNKNVKGKELGSSKPTQKTDSDPDNAPQGSEANAGKHVLDSTTGERKSVTQVDLETGAKTELIKESAAAVVSSPVPSKEHVERHAQALKRHYLDQLVNAAAEFIGTPRIRAKANFEFKGISRRLSGIWNCVEVTHKISDGAYESSATVKRGAYNEHGRKKSKGTSNTNNQTATDGAPQALKGVEINLETGEQTNQDPASQAVPNG